VAPICGPILGGYISDNFHWGWIFLINVPVGLIVAGCAGWRLRKPRDAHPQAADRHGGLGLLIVWVGALQVMLDTGKDADWFASTQIVVLAIVAAIAFVAWLIWELTENIPSSTCRCSRTATSRWAPGLLPGLCGVLRQHAADAAVAADPARLHRDLGGLVAAPTGVVAVLLTPLAAR
jgi:DHA2 family multidrug resistance protein